MVVRKKHKKENNSVKKDDKTDYKKEIKSVKKEDKLDKKNYSKHLFITYNIVKYLTYLSYLVIALFLIIKFIN